MAITDNILLVGTENVKDISDALKERVKARRLELELTQEGLAAKADIKLPTYRRFEHTGEISLSSLLRIAVALGVASDFNQLFSRPQYRSLDDIIRQGETKRKRGRRNG